jgi:hypothetical protein
MTKRKDITAFQRSQEVLAYASDFLAAIKDVAEGSSENLPESLSSKFREHSLRTNIVPTMIVESLDFLLQRTEWDGAKEAPKIVQNLDQMVERLHDARAVLAESGDICCDFNNIARNIRGALPHIGEQICLIKRNLKSQEPKSTLA